MLSNLENKLKFIELMDEMKNIYRSIRLKNGREETNAEHSFHLAMMVATLLEDFPDLNFGKCLQMALYHDLVEIFAGDTVIFDTKKEKTKHERETKALIELEQVLGSTSFGNIKEIISEYENKESREANFVHQLDKIQPIIQIVIQGGDSWKEYKIPKEKLIHKKYEQIDNTFGFRKILDRYFEIAEKGKMFYEE